MTGGRICHSLKAGLPRLPEVEAPVGARCGLSASPRWTELADDRRLHLLQARRGRQKNSSVLRGPFDRWLAEKAEERARQYICGIAVEELIKDRSIA